MATAVIKVPLNAILSYRIHSPHVRVRQDLKSKNKDVGFNDNFPLYARTDMVGYEGRSAEWLKAIEKIYNSPRNIRALFITKEKVIIKYWHSGENFELTNELKLSGVPNDVSNLEDANFTVTQLIDATVREMLTGQPNTLGAVLTGNGFKALRDWSLSNLEELYFDETMLIGCQPAVLKVLSGLGTITVKHDTSDRAKRLFGEDGVYAPYSLMEVSKMARTSMEGQCIGMLMGLLYTALGAAKNVKDGTLEFKDFPRLKFVGFIPGATANGLSVHPFFMDGHYVPEYNTVGSINSLVRTAITREQFLKTGIYVDTGVNLYTAPFSTLKVWLFDTEHLQGTFDKFKKWAINNEYKQNGGEDIILPKADAQSQEQSTKAPDKQADTKQEVAKPVKQEVDTSHLEQRPTCQLENLLNVTYKRLGPSGVRTSLSTMVGLRGEQEARQKISEFSEKGRNYYGKMLNDITRKG